MYIYVTMCDKRITDIQSYTRLIDARRKMKKDFLNHCNDKFNSDGEFVDTYHMGSRTAEVIANDHWYAKIFTTKCNVAPVVYAICCAEPRDSERSFDYKIMRPRIYRSLEEAQSELREDFFKVLHASQESVDSLTDMINDWDRNYEETVYNNDIFVPGNHDCDIDPYYSPTPKKPAGKQPIIDGAIRNNEPDMIRFTIKPASMHLEDHGRKIVWDGLISKFMPNREETFECITVCNDDMPEVRHFKTVEDARDALIEAAAKYLPEKTFNKDSFIQILGGTSKREYTVDSISWSISNNLINIRDYIKGCHWVGKIVKI